MPTIELRPFDNLDEIAAAFDLCVTVSVGDKTTSDRLIEMTARQLAAPGNLILVLDQPFRKTLSEAGYAEDSVVLQVTAWSRTHRRRTNLRQPTALLNLPTSPIEIPIGGDPSGVEVFAELVLASDAPLSSPLAAVRRHTRLAECSVDFVHEREPISFPRKQLTPEVCRRLNIPTDSPYFIEIAQEVLGDAFDSAVVIWIDKNLGAQMDQKELLSASRLVSSAIAVDAALAVGSAAWYEAAKDDDMAPELRFKPDLLCTRWLAELRSEAFNIRRAQDEAKISSYACEFARLCAKDPERMRAQLQSYWGSLEHSKKTLQEAQ